MTHTPSGRRIAAGLRRALLALAGVAMLISAPSAAFADDMRDVIVREFEAFDPKYRERRQHYAERLEALAARISSEQAAGNTLQCSQQMHLEAKWLLGYTARWDALEDKLERIERSLQDKSQDFATEQSPVDGFWGLCYDQWFMRVGESATAAGILASRGETPRYRLRPRLTTGRELINYLQSLLLSDIENTGIDHRAELSSVITSYSTAAYKQYLQQILIDYVALDEDINWEAVREAIWFFIHGSQDIKTGYWGAWYVIDGKILKTTDLSMTFHVVRYSKGEVEYWPQIIRTTLAIKDVPYPFGWRSAGKFNNHNLYDVASIFKFGWPHMSEAERATVRDEIREMLRWSLDNTLNPDGSYRHDPAYADTYADEYYFGVSLLDVLGYWNPAERFWTDDPLEPALAGRANCCLIKQRVNAYGFEGWAGAGALEKLESSCSACPAPGHSTTQN
ncbi:hypothetical protein OIU34_15640 [Pararhizobium sp. BT-229]|uniref:hypothetical protein n=1 Tax=Pararhizobium sp. BT-229 TaxID=2986923 RepID=UPI0021F6FF60|nr:hypothetical protein [Pararhizobium sp. BT-229]MCV9963339.1 hypothetical protein [Pararhizobium sp. BT-229]